VNDCSTDVYKTQILNTANIKQYLFTGDALNQCLSIAGPWHQVHRAARSSPGSCHFSFLSIFHAVPVAARSKALVCGRSPAEIVGSNPTGGHGCLSVVNVVCCQVEVSATS